MLLAKDYQRTQSSRVVIVLRMLIWNPLVFIRSLNTQHSSSLFVCNLNRSKQKERTEDSSKLESSGSPSVFVYKRRTAQNFHNQKIKLI